MKRLFRGIALVDRRGAVDPNCSEMHDAVRNRQGYFSRALRRGKGGKAHDLKAHCIIAHLGQAEH